MRLHAQSAQISYLWFFLHFLDDTFTKTPADDAELLVVAQKDYKQRKVMP
jgi:hypothetical protein